MAVSKRVDEPANRLSEPRPSEPGVWLQVWDVDRRRRWWRHNQRSAGLPGGPSRQVVEELHLAEPQPVEVDKVHVSSHARDQRPAIVQAKWSAGLRVSS